MLFERSPCKTCFKQKRGKDEIDIPWCTVINEDEGEAEQEYRKSPEQDTSYPLESHGIVSGFAPPPDECAEKGYRMIPGVRIANQPVHDKRRTEYDG